MKSFVVRCLSHRSWPWIVGVSATILTIPSLWTGFVADDYIHRAIFLRLPGFSTSRIDMFGFVGDRQLHVGLPWWAAPDLKLAFWRPVTALTHFADYALWPDAPWLMHLHSMLWYGAVVVVASVLFKQLFAVSWQAGLAAFVYAMSHTHAVPVFFLANRNALVGVFFGLLTLLLHHRWRQQRSRGAAILAPLALLIGLLSNEGAVAVCAYLLAYALFIERDSPVERLASVVPYSIVLVAWRALYQLEGYGARASAAYIDPVASPVRFLDAAATRAPMYLLAQWLFPPTDWSSLVSPATFERWWLFALLFAVLLCVVLLPLIKRDATARFWFTGMLLSIIPSCSAPPSDRMLMYSGIGAAALLAQFANAVHAGNLVPATARLRRLVNRILFDVFVAFHIIVSPIWLVVLILTTAPAFNHMTDGMEALAEQGELSHKLVVVADDVVYSSAYFEALRALANKEPVEHLLVLAPVTNRFDTIVLSRPSVETLVMEIDGSYDWFLERDDAHPFTVGDTVHVKHVAAEVLRTTRDGRPTKVAFRFDRPLEDSSIAWFGRIEPMSNGFPAGGTYSASGPPRIGQTISIR